MAENGGPTSALSTERTKVGVIGGGAWGTALAMHCARMGHDTLIWALEKEVADAINSQHENTVFLKVRSKGPWVVSQAGGAVGRPSSTGAHAAAGGHRLQSAPGFWQSHVPLPFCASCAADASRSCSSRLELLASAWC